MEYSVRRPGDGPNFHFMYKFIYFQAEYSLLSWKQPVVGSKQL